ncbi:hypothetical protein acdb102_20530 [Acidothermaceae bacterium B102]|nr:hypothetical protein acdb102_20530 [Acidothermaceae bacterium B102]
MRRYGTLLAVGLTIALSSGLTFTASAAHAAEDDCTAVVQDQADVLSPDQLTELKHHAAGLGATTMLRIRTVTTTNGETLNAYEKAEQQSCGWADAANVRQHQLLVVMVATQDRQMGIYPGPALVDTLTDPVWLAIEQQDMRPLFATQNWLGGLDAGIDALSTTLSGGTAPAAATAVASQAVSVIQTDANGNIIQGDGSSEHPFIADPNGILPGDTPSSGGTAGIGIGIGFAVVAVLVLVVIGVVRGGLVSSRPRRPTGYRGPDGVWIGGIDPLHQQHHPGMFGGDFGAGGGFGGGGGGDMGGGGGGSSSDGGGGSSGF